ncbi:hypothetical protein U9M48_000638 [Paspalum notatum var. saurae]|uniref:Uncharacterized protein n=1 Tax=Paspalum notatum var. saurae TaxID=547442 RepID=A0AAQ3PMS9_PASNO
MADGGTSARGTATRRGTTPRPHARRLGGVLEDGGGRARAPPSYRAGTAAAAGGAPASVAAASVAAASLGSTRRR